MIGNGISTPNFSLMFRIQGQVRKVPVDREAEQVAVQSLKLVVGLGERDELGGAHRVKSAGWENRISQRPL